MKIEMHEIVDIRSWELCNKALNDKAFWTFAATEWHRLYKDYVPMDQGILYTSVRITPGQIEHYAPYAHYQYEGRAYGPNYPITEGGRVVGFLSKPNRRKQPTGASLKYGKTKHPKASAKWDQAAEPTQKPKLISSLQAYINAGRLKL